MNVCLSLQVSQTDRHAHTELRNIGHLSTHQRSGFRGGKNKFWPHSFTCGVSKIATADVGCVKYNLNTEIEFEFLKVHSLYVYKTLWICTAIKIKCT
jgi:hypothetical protein